MRVAGRAPAHEIRGWHAGVVRDAVNLRVRVGRLPGVARPKEDRPNAGGLQNVYSVPGYGGDVTVSLARWSFACYKSASGATGEFDAETATFVTDQARVTTDCPKGP